MIQNYLKIAWRNLWKNRGYSALNIGGLAIGMMASIVITCWIQSEMTFDRFYSTTDRLYQVYSEATFEGKKHAWGNTAAILGPVLKEEHAEVEETVRISSLTDFNVLRVGDKKFIPKGLAADSSFFRLFDFKFLSGDTRNPIKSVNDIVITASLAQKFFGKENAVGKVIAFDTLSNMLVKAVIEDIPDNSRFRGTEYFCSWPLLERLGWVSYSSWGANNHQTFALLKPQADIAHVNRKIKNLIQKHSANQNQTSIFLHPASKWNLYNRSENGEMVAGRLNTVRLFIVIAIFILLIACINFTNLSTAQSEKRAKEVGVRKVVGARKNMLINQFLTESILLSFISGVLAIVLTIVVLPFFNQIVGKQLQVPTADLSFWLLLVSFILLSGILAGVYPAFFLSSLKPIKTLKGTFVSAGSVFNPRKVLVVLQFTFSITLIICTLIVSKQIRYAQERDSGYDKNQLIYTSLAGQTDKHYEVIKHELLNKGAAIAVSKSLGPITRYSSNGWGFSWPGSKPEDYDVVFDRLSADADFTKTMQVKLLAGRDIDIQKFPSDSTAILLNRTAVKRMGLKDPLGVEIVQGKGEKFAETWHVVGVIEDFILTSPYDPVEPLIVCGPSSWFNYMHIRLNPANSIRKNMELSEQVFNRYNPNYPFEYTFADEAYAEKFKNEQFTANLTAIFSALAILIACLGLFGLAAFTTQQRSKEIGIRKVLGASATTITLLISKGFVQLVMIAFLISMPIAWWTMSKWLNSFSYRIEIQGLVFLITGTLSFAIVILTVGYQVIRAALANPVDSLRNE
ncbi:ABC transporter permease [Olivibacter sp. XZL3]|uniref:ABC transporter permease n=1 Tax=Olivibacter sp. XZL3 TaxID=1735116 RepID=UPI0010653AC9|nr:ABC transporter permease [Olivibacter sp. XZL3]